MKKKIGIGLLVVVVGMQLVRIDKTNPPVDEAKDIIAVTNPPSEVTEILKAACYDCHSNETAYPWYSNVAPVSWWLQHHVEEGREHLNFSQWGDYDDKKAEHKLDECIEMLEEGKMPMNSYTWTHEEAVLTDKEKELLLDWMQKMMNSYGEVQ